MTRHTIAPHEEKALHKLSNVVYDQLSNDLEMSEERTDEATKKAIDAVRKFLEEGR